MILKDNDIITRLNSPANLINRLSADLAPNNKRASAMGLFGVASRGKEQVIERSKPIISTPDIKQSESLTTFQNPFLPSSPILSPQDSLPETKEPTIDQLLTNSEAQIKLAAAHDSALSVLSSAINELKAKLPDMKADKLPAAITATSKVVESIRKERAEAAKNTGGRSVHYHFYTPEQKKISDYNIIEVS